MRKADFVRVGGGGLVNCGHVFYKLPPECHDGLRTAYQQAGFWISGTPRDEAVLAPSIHGSWTCIFQVLRVAEKVGGWLPGQAECSCCVSITKTKRVFVYRTTKAVSLYLTKKRADYSNALSSPNCKKGAVFCVNFESPVREARNLRCHR